jgi:WD40 repeat protein
LCVKELNYSGNIVVMKRTFALACIFIFWISAVSGQSNSEEIQRLQMQLKQNEEMAIRAEARAQAAEERVRWMRCIAQAAELAEISYEIPDKELSALLTVQAYNLYEQNMGYAFNNKIYHALLNALKKHDLLTQHVKGKLPAQSSTPNNTTVSAVMPDGQHVVTADQNGNLKFVANNGTIVRILSGHTAQVDQIKFSKSGQFMITAGKDNTVRIWSLNQLNLRPIVISESASISNLTFSTDDSQIMYTLLTTRGKPTDKAIPINMENMVAELCKVLTRNLTKEEWSVYVGNDLPYEQTCSMK